MEHNRTNWSKKLDDALCGYRTTFKMLIGTTPYWLVYGKACHLPIELEHKAYQDTKFLNFDLNLVGKKRNLQLNELEEWCELAYENVRLYKERTKKYHDQHIKETRQIKEGDQVLLYNS